MWNISHMHVSLLVQQIMKLHYVMVNIKLEFIYLKWTACILSIVKQITSPGGMHETSARAWWTGKTQRNRVEREVGGGIGMGNTCNSMADSCQCWQNPLKCEVISLQLIKINEKKINKINKNFWLYHVACGVLVLWPGIEPRMLALKMWNLLIS